MSFLKKYLLGCLTLALSACALPKKPVDNIPDSISRHWTSLATTASGNVHYYIDMDSLKQDGTEWIFVGKTTFAPGVHPEDNAIPQYQTAINTWAMNCHMHSYRIVATKLYDAEGQLILDKAFGKSEVASRPIDESTPAGKQYQKICAKNTDN